MTDTQIIAHVRSVSKLNKMFNKLSLDGRKRFLATSDGSLEDAATILKELVDLPEVRRHGYDEMLAMLRVAA